MGVKMVKSTKIFIIIIILAMAAIGAILAFVPRDEIVAGTVHGFASQENNSIRIGVFAPLTGEGAFYGNTMKKGLDLAMEDINNEGGILGKQIQLVYEDTYLDPKAAVTAMNKFIHVDKLPIVIAAEGSGATSAAAPLADSTKTLMMIGIASTPTLKDAGDYVFRVIPSDDYQGEEMVRLATELGHENAGILYVNDAYGVGIRDVFSEGFSTVGGVIIEEAFESEATDFKTQLTKIKASNPDVIIMIARKEFPLILKQAKELGLSAQIIASETLKNEELIQASGDSAEGVLITYFSEPIDYVNFKAKFQAKYGADPSSYSDFGYDALQVLAIAIEDAGTTSSEKVKNALYDVVYQGATGIVKFDSNGEITGKPFTIYKVMDGKFENVKE